MAGLIGGVSKSDGDTVSAADWNNNINNAVPQPALITQWASKSALSSSDQIMLADADASAALKQTTLGNFPNFLGISKVSYAFSDSGSDGTAIFSSPSPTITSLATGQGLWFKPGFVNSSTVTLTVGTHTTHPVYMDGSALVGKEFRVNGLYFGIYNGTQFDLVRPAIGKNSIDGTSIIVRAIDKSNLASSSIIRNLVNGRLTLTSGTAVTTSDVTGAGTIYFTPYRGNSLSLYDGTNWNLYNFSEVSLALTATSANNYDVFIYDNSGTLTLETLIWTNSTTRATALVLQDGVWVKSGATTRRYLGTFRASGTNTTEDSVTKRFLFNYYNQVPRKLLRQDTTDTWTYGSNTFHQANASALNQVEVVCGLAEACQLDLVLMAMVQAGNSVNPAASIGIGSTTVSSADVFCNINNNSASVFQECSVARLTVNNLLGYQFYTWIERAISGTATFYGDNGGACQSGLTGTFLA